MDYWHNGLFVKLVEIGVSYQLIKTYINMYRSMVSQVKNGSILSNTIKLQQGTRQGGKSSPILSLLFINGLIQELQQSNLGLCIFDRSCSSPTVADDMVLVSLSKHGL